MRRTCEELKQIKEYCLKFLNLIWNYQRMWPEKTISTNQWFNVGNPKKRGQNIVEETVSEDILQNSEMSYYGLVESQLSKQSRPQQCSGEFWCRSGASWKATCCPLQTTKTASTYLNIQQFCFCWVFDPSSGSPPWYPSRKLSERCPAHLDQSVRSQLSRTWSGPKDSCGVWARAINSSIKCIAKTNLGLSSRMLMLEPTTSSDKLLETYHVNLSFERTPSAVSTGPRYSCFFDQFHGQNRNHSSIWWISDPTT